MSRTDQEVKEYMRTKRDSEGVRCLFCKNFTWWQDYGDAGILRLLWSAPHNDFYFHDQGGCRTYTERKNQA